MKRSQAEAAIEAATARAVGDMITQFVGNWVVGDPKSWAKAEIEKIVNAYNVMHEALAEIDFDPEKPAPGVPAVETDQDLRRRLLEVVDEGSIHRGRAETTIGSDLDKIAEAYGLKRGEPAKAKS